MEVKDKMASEDKGILVIIIFVVVLVVLAWSGALWGLYKIHFNPIKLINMH